MVKVRSILDFIRKMYPLRTCNLNLTEKNINTGKLKVCLEFHIGNCQGPCEARQSKEDYDHSISQIRHILTGNLGVVILNLKQQMQEYASQYRFEEAEVLTAAALLKKRLNIFNSYSNIFVRKTSKRLFILQTGVRPF